MIVVDIKVLYALADRRDEHRAGRLRGNDEVLLVPPTVLAKACLPDITDSDHVFLDATT